MDGGDVGGREGCIYGWMCAWEGVGGWMDVMLL